MVKFNDPQLLTRAKEFDPAALRRLHQEFYGPVARYIQFKVRGPQTVEDLSGEVFVRVLDSLKRGQGWRDSPKGWILGIAHNVVVDYYRKQERITELFFNESIISSEDTDPIHQAMVSDKNSRLKQAIEQLTDGQREVITLRFIEGLSINDVAKIVNKTPSAIKGLQYRAIRVLAELMKEPVAEEIVRSKH